MALAEIESTIAGVWVLVKNENLDEYLKEIGIGFVLRKLAAAASSTMTISIEDDDYVRIVTKGPKDSDTKFRLGEETESTDPQDNPMKALVTWEGGKMITEAKPTEGSKAMPTRVERRLEGDQLIMDVTVNAVAMRRIFKRKS